MRYTPYKFQQAAVDHAVDFLGTAPPDTRQLYAAPTGCGKSVVELLLHERFSDLWIVTPREEIIAGMLDKLGVDADSDPMDHRIATPVKLRNRLLSGALEAPKRLVFDEGHHHSAETWQQIALLSGLAPAVAYTATPYRGTPKSTRDFLAHWGEPLWLITDREAVQQGYVVDPEYLVIPLVDDDVVEVQGGEFSVTSLEAATVDRLGDMADHAKPWYNGHLWDRPTIFSLPSSSLCVRLKEELRARGLPSFVVSAATPRAERQLAFRATAERMTAILQISILGEGIDFKFRRLVDLAPTLSPVKWVQALGRVRRPMAATGYDPHPQYVVCNRNLFRHSYALQGAVPVSTLVAADGAFPASSRASTRVLGLEALGRFKPAYVKLNNGLPLGVYALSTVFQGAVVEYCVLVHPSQDPVWAVKVDTVDGNTRTYGQWSPCEPPSELVGFSSVDPREPSPKQRAWWQKQAHRFGLDSTAEVTRKGFRALPVLNDLGKRFV